MAELDLSIIIVNWNSACDVRKCLHSIFQNTREITFEVIVVDSASFDGCGEMLAREFPDVRFLQSQENIGFGKANNLGCRGAVGEFVLFLNPDTEVLGTAIPTLLESARRLPNAGCVGCRLLNSDRSLQTSCIQAFPSILNQILDADFLRNRFPRSPLWGIAPLFDSPKTPATAEAISGACIMMRREIFLGIGGFSPDYFMYAEDIDLCYKAAKAGRTNYYVPTASIVHHGDGSVRKARSNFAVVMAVDSLTRYFVKYHGSVYAFFFRLAITGSAFCRLVLLLPLRLLQYFHSSELNSWSKWRAVFRWGWGLERWIARY
jgi:GT2 family glycosyltransferase